MGDRGNIVIRNKENDKHIFLYTHRSGYRMPERLHEALEKGKDRWDDAPYLSRIIFQALLNGDTSATGVGLTTYLTDNEYPLLVVDIEENKVGWCDEKTNISTAKLQCSFKEFMKLDGIDNNEFCWKALTGKNQ